MLPTPTEWYETAEGVPILVKREDQCTPEGGPPFSKMRGVRAYFSRIREEGARQVIYVESAVSMAGWGAAWMARQEGMECIIFDPQYKGENPPLLEVHRKQWDDLGALRIPVQAGRTSVNWYMARRWRDENAPGAVLLPIGLNLEESIQAAKDEAGLMSTRPGSVVVCVGSGTIAAGLMAAFSPLGVDVYGILVREGNVRRKVRKMYQMAGVIPEGLLGGPGRLLLEDPGWDYAKPSRVPCPFPTHPWYDGKAWEWLETEAPRLPQPIVFWNIGRLPCVMDTTTGS